MEERGWVMMMEKRVEEKVEVVLMGLILVLGTGMIAVEVATVRVEVAVEVSMERVGIRVKATRPTTAASTVVKDTTVGIPEVAIRDTITLALALTLVLALTLAREIEADQTHTKATKTIHPGNQVSPTTAHQNFKQLARLLLQVRVRQQGDPTART